MRWVRLFVPETKFERDWIGTFIIDEAPKSPFDSVTLATQQQVGLFVLPCFPRP